VDAFPLSEVLSGSMSSIHTIPNTKSENRNDSRSLAHRHPFVWLAPNAISIKPSLSIVQYTHRHASIIQRSIGAEGKDDFAASSQAYQGWIIMKRPPRRTQFHAREDSRDG